MKRAAAWGQGSMGRRDAHGAGGNLEGERWAHIPTAVMVVWVCTHGSHVGTDIAPHGTLETFLLTPLGWGALRESSR